MKWKSMKTGGYTDILPNDCVKWKDTTTSQLVKD